MLTQMFDMQSELQVECKNDVDSQEFRNMMALALSNEIHEALGETPWKPWKKNQRFNRKKYKKELIDCWAFLINMTFPVMNPTELYDLFVDKFIINIDRQKKGY